MRRDKILRLIYDLADGVEYFDYPDYGGLPEEIYMAFSPEFVDSVQEYWDQVRILGRKDWVHDVLERANFLGDDASLYRDVQMPKKFKTRLAGRTRKRAINQGRLAARNGWERRSPAPNSRWGDAWLEGYDAELANPSTLKHCTSCGHMFSTDVDVCPSCESPNVRHNVGVGTEIVMTVEG